MLVRCSLRPPKAEALLRSSSLWRSPASRHSLAAAVKQFSWPHAAPEKRSKCTCRHFLLSRTAWLGVAWENEAERSRSNAEVQFLEFCFEWLPQSRFASRSLAANGPNHSAPSSLGLVRSSAGCFPDHLHDQHQPSQYLSRSRRSA